MFLMLPLLTLRPPAIQFGRILRRFLRRFSIVLIRDMQVVLHGDRLTVADPRADDVRREIVAKLRLPCSSAILKQLAPRRHARRADDPRQPGPKVHRLVAVLADDIHAPGLFRLV